MCTLLGRFLTSWVIFGVRFRFSPSVDSAGHYVSESREVFINSDDPLIVKNGWARFVAATYRSPIGRARPPSA
jgi:hypothetical protein